jgi:TonB family protein
VCLWRVLLTLTTLILVSNLLSAGLAARDTSKTDAGRSTEKKHSDPIYEIGGDVKPPKLVHVVEPEFSAHSEQAFVSGVVKIQIIVTSEGMPKDPKVLSGLSEVQNKKAVEAVAQWRFQPATKEDKPVNVRVTVEVNFHLL